MIIKKNKKIKFIKPILDKLYWTGKRERYSALNQEALCIEVNKNSKAYYAQFATVKIVDGKRVSKGHRKFLAPYSDPLELVKDKLYKKLADWKKAAKADVDCLNVAALAKNFIKHGSKDQRVKTIGKRLDYKKKTTDGYNSVLRRYVLLETKDDPRKNVITGDEWINKMSSKFSYKGSDYEGALKNVPLDKLSQTDIQIWMARLIDKQAAANHALAALSTAIEYDLKRPKDYLLPKGMSNPCVRVAKYDIDKDQKPKSYAYNVEVV